MHKHLHEHPFTVCNSVLEVNANIIRMRGHMKDVTLAQNTEELELAISLVDKHATGVYKHFTLIDKRFLGDKTMIEKVRNLFSYCKSFRSEIIVFTREGRINEVIRGGSRHDQ